MSRSVRVAMVQTLNAYLNMPSDLEALGGHLEDVRSANVDHNVDLIRKAAASGVQLICLSELCTGPYFALEKREMWKELAEEVGGPSIAAFRDAARESSVIVVAPIYEKCGSRRFNTAVVIGGDGELLGKYRKVHIPNGGNEQGEFHEAFYYGPSDGQLENGEADVSSNPYFPVFNTDHGRLGVCICYDRHFAGSVSSLVENGAEIVLCPAVTFGEKSLRMWPQEFAVDAARHRVWIGGSNRLGSESPWHQDFFGATHFVGPSGPAELLELEEPCLVAADLDLGVLVEPDPSGWDIPRDRRPETYGSK